MVFRLISVVLVLSILCSCQNLSSNKNDDTINTDIDFSTVDASPSFTNCEKLIDNEKTDCFRITIQEEFATLLEQQSFVTAKNIDETIIIVLHIDKQGDVKIKGVQSSAEIKNQLPELNNNLKAIVAKLPKLTPAIKRGIPVASEYKLPIQIKTFNK